jgi:hypothetical protein
MQVDTQRRLCVLKERVSDTRRQFCDLAFSMATSHCIVPILIAVTYAAVPLRKYNCDFKS